MKITKTAAGASGPVDHEARLTYTAARPGAPAPGRAAPTARESHEQSRASSGPSSGRVSGGDIYILRPAEDSDS